MRVPPYAAVGAVIYTLMVTLRAWRDHQLAMSHSRIRKGGVRKPTSEEIESYGCDF